MTKLNKGLNLDIAPIDQPESSWRDARNVVFSRLYESISNEDGFLELLDLPAQPIGIIPLDKDDFVVFTSDPTFDEIGVVSGQTYTRVIRTTSVTDRFNFSTAYPIKGKFRISNRGERIIAFTDNLNPPRVLNITTLPFPVDMNKVPTEAGSINTLNIFSAGDPPTISFTLNQTGGFLKAGAYFFSCSYTAQDNTETAYFTATGPVKINDDNTGSTSESYDGAAGGTVTSKTVTVQLSGVDNRYKYLNIGVISIIAGETKFQKVGQVEIVDGTSDYVFTYVGNETTTDLLLEQLTAQFQGIYSTAKAITVINDQLAFGNLGSRPPFNYQAYANNIQIKWNAQLVNILSSNTIQDISALQKGGFRSFEVYAFYIVFRYKDGSYSPAYHIPGRQSNPADIQNSALSNAEGFTAKKFQVEDTCLTDGTMSYWENEGETYPSDFPDFAGQNVRHHKFPSIRYIKANGPALGFSAGNTDLIGLTLMPVISFTASNVIIPAELASQIDGWQIYYAKRDIQNQTCVGQGHSIFSHIPNDSSNTDVLYGTVNAATNLVLDVTSRRPSLNRLTFHSPDLLLNKPQISPNYIRNEFRLFTTTIPGPGNNQDSSTGPIITSNTDTLNSRYRKQYMLLDYCKEQTYTKSLITNSGDLIRRIVPGNPLYVPANVVISGYFNAHSSEYINLEVFNGNTLTIAPNLTVTTSSGNILPFGSFSSGGYADITRRREDVYLTNVCQLIATVYAPFTTQSLVAASDILGVGVSTTGQVLRGDSYTGVYSFTATAYIDEFLDGNKTVWAGIDTLPRGHKVIRRYACESNINFEFRHEGTDDNSKYYGKSSYPVNNSTNLSNSYLISWDVNKGQILEYNSDYSAVNSFNPVFPRNTTIDTLERFPYRIIMSEKNANELADSGWKTFLPNNYYDMLTTKGEIVNLEGYDDTLLIHLENSLFRTVPVQTLKTGTEEVTIGTGELFAIPPKEIIVSDMGYLGNQNLFGCGMTKLGYAFFDAQQGKLFLVSKEVKEISSKGLRAFMRDNFRSNPVLDNPFTSTGLSIAFDEKYNRLIATKKGTNSFTVSYSPDIDAFASFHDYIPDFIFNTRNLLYSLKGTTIYRHNHTNKATYYDGTVYPSYITPVFNPEPNTTKYFPVFKWQTEIIGSTSIFHKTFTNALIYNSYQCSGNIDLIYPDNIFNSETTWNFNKFFDIVKDRSLPFMDSNGLILSNLDQSMAWFKQRKFVDKWTAIKLSYDNTDQNTLFLYDVDCLMRRSPR